ncbi:TPA: DUF4297 domain-containing protein [Staphylococcus aureus]|uniref:dsDNA nuclease domain-containing protein n=1 Tax=Staphylococcus aureus TaxID=1280 RepID=UPI003B7EF593
MVRENGGANAQRGFNYQNCVISLVAIRNYKKPNFKIYVEADEDFEVNYGDDYHACIQVKGEKNLTFNKLLKGEKGKLSIFEKNLSSGKSDSVYKIVVFSFSRKDMESMQEQTDEEELFSNSWLLSNDQKNKVNNDCVENFSLVKTAFDNDMKNARIYLKGELVQQNIVVEGRAEVILNELFQQILQKSEKKVQTEQDKELKKITSKELDLILQKITAKARFEKELKNLRFNSLKEEKIKKEEKKIILEYMAVKKAVIRFLKSDEEKLENNSISTLISETFNLSEMNCLSENTKYAIAISAYCDILEEIAYE